MTSLAGPKLNFSLSVISDFFWQRSRTKLKYSRWNDTDGVWDTSKVNSWAFCELVSNQGHPRSLGQRSNFKILCLGGDWCATCFWIRFLSRTQKGTLEHILNGPNRPKSENSKSADILLNGTNSDLLGHSKRQNPAVFQDSGLKFCAHISKYHYTYIPFFEQSKTSRKVLKSKNDHSFRFSKF